MTCRSMVGGIVFLFSVVLISGAVRADDDAATSAEVDPAQIEALMKEFAKPGKAHKHFKRLAGTWKTETKSYYQDPENPSTSEGESKFTIMMGGRYLRQNFRGEFGGQRFIGMGIVGYDNAKKKYVGTWVDNHGTGMMRSEGTYDEKTNTMTETGTSSSPVGEMKMKMTSKYIDDNKFLFTMYALQGDAEQKIMEITYTKQKADAGKKE